MKNYSIKMDEQVNIDDAYLEAVIGTLEYRREALKDVIKTGITSYGSIKLEYDSQSEIITIESFFNTTLSMRYYKQGENILYEKLRKDIDEIIKEEMHKQLVEDIWR